MCQAFLANLVAPSINALRSALIFDSISKEETKWSSQKQLFVKLKKFKIAKKYLSKARLATDCT